MYVILAKGCLLVEFEYRHKRFLRYLDRAELTHTLFAFLLLFEQLFLSRDVAAVALCKYVLAHRLYRLSCDNLSADRNLNRHLKELTRNMLL